MDLKKYAAKTTPLSVDFGDGDVIKLTYSPNAITTDEALSTDRTPEQNVAQAAALIATWDLTDGEAPVALTRKALGALPINLMGKVLSAILEDLQVPQARASS